MIRPIVAAVLTLTLSSGWALAAPPASKEACLEEAFALAEKAVAKKFPAEKQAKIEGQLTALETKCTADDLVGAEGDIKTIEAELAGG